MSKSDVRMVTSINGFNKLKEYIDTYIDVHYENEELENLLNKIDFKYENDKQCYFGWNNYNWNEFEDENIQILDNGILELEDSNYSYRFYRLGKETFDYEEYFFDSNAEGENNLEYPNIIRKFDDDYMINILHKQNTLEDKEDFDYE